MKKLYATASALLLTGALVAQKNYNEYAPTVVSESNTAAVHPTTNQNDRAAWDIQLDADPTLVAASLAGCYWTGTEFWVSKWNADSLYTLNASGAMTSSFVVPGVSGVRSITSDGTSIYVGTATSDIFEINPSTKTLVSTITTSVPSVRYCSFDPTLDGGNGGFWTGAYSSDIVAVSMTGTTLTTISAATHALTGIYGLSYDGYSVGGPFLWAYDQGGSTAVLYQLDMTGTQTGMTHNTQSDLAGGNSGIAGGMFVANNYVPGTVSIGGINQGVSIFAYEALDPTGISENETFTFSVYPNPAKEVLNIEVSEEDVEAIHIYSMDGTLINSPEKSTTSIDISQLPKGTYILTIQSEIGVANQRFIKE